MSMTMRENNMAIFNGKQPDYYGDIMDAVEFVFDPIFNKDRIPQDGERHLDSWGTTYIWKPDSPGAHPVAAPETLVIKNIEDWKTSVTPPRLDDFDWTETERLAAEVDRSEKFVGFFCASGLFERSHHLMGFENALVEYMLNEDKVAELLRFIADFKIEHIKKAAKYMKPDIIFFHDDWGSKTNVFLPPDLWRRLIKPLHKEIVDVAHDCGMIFMHHADCYCEPLVCDMVEMGIDIWQGAIPQNDICEIQRVTKGQLPMSGGIDGPKIDVVNITEEAIRAEVRRTVDEYCPGGKFFPGIPGSRCHIEFNERVWRDELEKYGREWAEKHPIT